MDAAALNMTTEIRGYGSFLFVHLPRERADRELIDSLEAIGAPLENMHDADGHPSERAARGRVACNIFGRPPRSPNGTCPMLA